MARLVIFMDGEGMDIDLEIDVAEWNLNLDDRQVLLDLETGIEDLLSDLERHYG